MNCELPDVQARFRKGRKTRDQISNICWVTEKARNSRKKSVSFTTLKPLTVWITANCKILQELGVPDHLTFLLINLYAGQEATVRTGHGTMVWFEIGKRVCQGCILSPYLFNLYAEEINPEYSSKWLMLKLKLQYFGHLMQSANSLEKTWPWERLKAGGWGGDRGWDCWMASLTWWTWVWVSSGSWWWTGKPGVLQSMGSQRVRQQQQHMVVCRRVVITQQVPATIIKRLEREK